MDLLVYRKYRYRCPPKATDKVEEGCGLLGTELPSSSLGDCNNYRIPGVDVVPLHVGPLIASASLSGLPHKSSWTL